MHGAVTKFVAALELVVKENLATAGPRSRHAAPLQRERSARRSTIMLARTASPTIFTASVMSHAGQESDLSLKGIFWLYRESLARRVGRLSDGCLCPLHHRRNPALALPRRMSPLPCLVKCDPQELSSDADPKNVEASASETMHPSSSILSAL